MTQLVFESRKEKELFLKTLISKLHITEPEKDIYSICIEVLEDDAFDSFFLKIAHQVDGIENTGIQEPLNLILQ
jgi:hypothetical protein